MSRKTSHKRSSLNKRRSHRSHRLSKRYSRKLIGAGLSEEYSSIYHSKSETEKAEIRRKLLDLIDRSSRMSLFSAKKKEIRRNLDYLLNDPYSDYYAIMSLVSILEVNNLKEKLDEIFGVN